MVSRCVEQYLQCIVTTPIIILSYLFISISIETANLCANLWHTSHKHKVDASQLASEL